MNVEKLTTIRDWIAGGRLVLRDDLGFIDFGAIFKMNYGLVVEEKENFCRTTCCIAGAAVLLDAFSPMDMTAQEIVRENALKAEDDWDILLYQAKRVLDLTLAQAKELFHPQQVTFDDPKMAEKWGGEIRLEDITNEWAVKVIDHFIATGDVDWSVGRPKGSIR